MVVVRPCAPCSHFGPLFWKGGRAAGATSKDNMDQTSSLQYIQVFDYDNIEAKILDYKIRIVENYCEEMNLYLVDVA